MDWDDNINTGEAYPPSWSDEVTDVALQEWEDNKRGNAKDAAPEPPASPPPPAADSEEEDSQEPRPSNWRRNGKRPNVSGESQLPPSSSDYDEPPRKKVRIGTHDTASEDTVPFTSSTGTADPEVQSPKSLRSEDFARLAGQKLAIELSKPSQFDPTEYHSVVNTQSSQLVSELEEEDSRAILASQLSQRTIPDSQDLSGQTWAQSPVGTPTTPTHPHLPDQKSSRCCIPVSSLVVSDSQGHSFSCPESGAITSQRSSVVPVNQGISAQSQQDIIPDSELTNSDIPSHQLEQPQPKSSGSPNLSTAPEPRPASPLVSGTLASRVALPSTVAGALHESIFLTQPQGLLDSSAPPSSSTVSLAIRALESSGGTDRSSPHRNRYTNDPSETRNTLQSCSRESQAAQFVPRDFESFPDNITDSHHTERNPESQPKPRWEDLILASPSVSQNNQPRRDSEGREHSAVNPPGSSPSVTTQFQASQSGQELQGQEYSAANPLESNFSSTAHSQTLPEESLTCPEQPTPWGEIPESPIAITLSQGGPISNMDESSTPKPQSSAIDELKSLFDFGNASLASDLEDLTTDVQTESAPQQQSPSSVDLAGETTVAPQVVIRSPEPDVLSQSLFPVEPWKPEVMGSAAQDMPPPSISPASIMVNPNQSAVESMREIVNSSFGDPSNSIARSLMVESPGDVPQGTVSPADISNSMDPVDSVHTLIMPFSDRTVISSGQSITMGQGTDHQAYTESSSSSQNEVPLSEHIVTLPFQASRRPFYDETLLEYRLDAEKFGEYFSSEVYKDPDEALIKRIDELLGRLMNICDYPQDLVGTKLEDLPANEQAKYSADANPKFNFMFELLQTIEKETEILVIARTPELLRLLFAQAEALELEFVCQSVDKLESANKDSPVRVTLALSSEDLDPFKFDAVVGFDHTFNSSPISQRLSSSSNGGKAPLVLQLVTTHSIEHIALHVPQEISPLERKNALLSGIVQARRLIDDPDRGYVDPHEVAEVFSNYLNGFTESISWQPQSIPDYVIDFYLSSQSRSQMPAESKMLEGNGLKRKLDSEEDSDDAKRIRVFPVMQPAVESNDPPLTYALRELLNSSKPKDAASERMSKISVPLAVLEGLAEKVSEYQRQAAANDLNTEHKAIINGLEKRLKEFERTTNKVSESHRKALQERSSFEKAKLKADEAMKAAAEAAQKETEKHQKRIAELEASVARLTSAPEATGTEEGPLAKTERLYEESEKKVKLLEKRLENAQKEADYIRNLYQDVNSTAGGLGAEIKGLREQNEDLQKKASENMLRIQQIQADNANKELLRTLSDLKIQLREREIEVAHLREELSLRNVRPATRQASVPRSPRMGSMMSPRAGRGFGGSASRGTSPAAVAGYDGNGSGAIPGVQFMGQQPGNGRWGHLRD